MPTRQTDNLFKTTDLALASTLSLGGLQFDLEPTDEGDRMLFVFNPVTADEISMLQRTVDTFEDRRARVEPLQFLKEVRKVRERLYAALDGRVAPEPE